MDDELTREEAMYLCRQEVDWFDTTHRHFDAVAYAMVPWIRAGLTIEEAYSLSCARAGLTD